MMKRSGRCHLALMICLCAVLSGCSTVGASESAPVFAEGYGGQSLGRSAPAGAAAEPVANQTYTIQSAAVEVEVGDLADSAAKIESIIEAKGGLIESRHDGSEEAAYLNLRVPAASLRSTVDEIGSIGEVLSSSFSEQDVTDQYTDAEAKLTNLRALRDRLRGILDRAKDVKDVLAVEEQLNRVQTELDQLEARFKQLKGKIQMSSLQVSLRKKHTPGPLGIIVQGGAWIIEKLFVLD